VRVGGNPSTAEPNNLAPTVRNVQTLAGLKGFDGWLMLNLYPQRTSDPRQLHRCLHEDLHRENLRQAQGYVSKLDGPNVWAGWGTIIMTRPYLITCLKERFLTRICARFEALAVCPSSDIERG
jgi:hypothetical protein